nr:MarR family transcriptional regulator [Knoellia sp. DB2414S]
MVLSRHPMPIVSMARRLRISPQATSRAVAELERRELVEKRPSPRDSRALLVSRTAEGEALMHEVREDLVVTVCIMADALSEDRLGELADELAELASVEVDNPRW